jgi:predicted transcriptional regulator
MATNLRLRPDAETALRERAERTGESQQQLIRQAIDEFLGLGVVRTPQRRSIDELIAAGVVKPPKEPFRRVSAPLVLPEGVTSLDLLDRDDRF